MDGLEFTGLLSGLPAWAMALGAVLGLFGVALVASMRRFLAGKGMSQGTGRMQR